MDKASPIRNVSDTALWVAIYRAIESERPDAHFRDPYARRLGGKRGEAIANAMPGGARASSWPLVVRTAVMDEIVLRCVREGITTVLNLAAGLDARPYRLDVPPTLRWIHVDLPAMVDYFRTHMAQETPRCALEFESIDLRDSAARDALFARVATQGPLLVITEGLLLYLTAEQVADLARALHDGTRARWWLTDLASPMLIRMLERHWAPKLREGRAPFTFGPENGTAFFAPFGWHEAEFRSTLDEGWRLDRNMPFAWFWRWLSNFQSPARREAIRRMSSIVLLRSSHPETHP